ncbi:MAG: twin-arginine translocase subunit TatB [Rhodanobacter sp.]|nr:MAG: twin-arginine translocase subunit TatB [Rhodanobacter sp.]TAM09941.1 MAG: twin-arginine translocase subunit TatB [Rhodanobacter sp.]TAM36720.1 MAG: twin-arginine translocase subunit TatB [Rhodanobacter sp.]
MIELDFGKLILLALIALVVLGPEKLPVAARTAGALLRRLRGGWASVQAEVARDLQYAELKTAVGAAHTQAVALESQAATLASDLRDAVDAVAAPAPVAPGGDARRDDPA